MSGFQSQFGKGFRITFANGWGVSVQWGPANYCANRSFDYVSHTDMLRGQSSPNAEVAVFRPDGSFAQLTEYDQVEGYQSPEQVLVLMNSVASGTFVEVEATKFE